MINILYLCREYGWHIDYVLGLPFKSIGALMKATSRLENIGYSEGLRISLAAGGDNKYATKLAAHYSKCSISEKAIAKNKPKSVNTTDAFSILRGAL